MNEVRISHIRQEEYRHVHKMRGKCAGACVLEGVGEKKISAKSALVQDSATFAEAFGCQVLDRSDDY
jgi:hypothetical protein